MSTENTSYLFSDFLNKGACLYCISKTCTRQDQHGISIPNELSDSFKNPINIKELKTAITNAKLDFKGKIPQYNICKYTNNNCNNCKSFRIKYIMLNDQKLAICYSPLNIATKTVNVGLHIDLKLVIKNKIPSIIAIPIKLEIENIIKNFNTNTQNIIENKPIIVKNIPTIVESISNNIIETN
jgi:hypothetical protein